VPFLSLNDQRQFNNLSLVWIYVIAAVVSTLLTFIASWAWNRFIQNHAENYPSQPNQPQPDVVDAENVGEAADGVLEPAAYIEPEAEELVQRFLDALRRSSPDASDGEDNGEDLAESCAVQREDKSNLENFDETSTRRPTLLHLRNRRVE
jgi:hypothetical protein